MGIYDRDYYREEAKPLFQVRAPTRMLTTIIIINVVVFVADAISPANWVSHHLAARPDSLIKPWLWWQLLSYGFVHSPTELSHILFNMVSLFFLGRVVEDLYGKWEFLRLYLVMLVAGSVAWAAGNLLLSRGAIVGEYHLIGASGAVTGVIVLMILNFPNQTLILFPIPIPIRAWVLGVFIIAINILGFTGKFGGNVAYGVHLVGAGFGFLY
jgi:membrane associated rhomboid family serine protease